jgi:hypothetical protein
LDVIGKSTPPGVTRWATLRLVQQAPVEHEDFDADPPDDFWTKPLPVSEEVIEIWVLKAAFEKSPSRTTHFVPSRRSSGPWK